MYLTLRTGNSKSVQPLVDVLPTAVETAAGATRRVVGAAQQADLRVETTQRQQRLDMTALAVAAQHDTVARRRGIAQRCEPIGQEGHPMRNDASVQTLRPQQDEVVAREVLWCGVELLQGLGHGAAGQRVAHEVFGHGHTLCSQRVMQRRRARGQGVEQHPVKRENERVLNGWTGTHDAAAG